jgi:hypothetical protein
MLIIMPARGQIRQMLFLEAPTSGESLALYRRRRHAIGHCLPAVEVSGDFIRVLFEDFLLARLPSVIDAISRVHVTTGASND